MYDRVGHVFCHGFSQCDNAVTMEAC